MMDEVLCIDTQYLENAPTSTLFLLKESTSACASFNMVSSPDIRMLNACP